MNRYRKRIISIALTVMMFAGCIVPFEFSVYAAGPFTVTWMNQDGTGEPLETDTDVAENATPSFDGVDPTKAADEKYTYTFAGWAESPNQETGVLEDKLPAVTKDTTYYAAFSKTEKTPAPAAPGNFKATPLYEKVKLTWSAVSGANGKVYYEIKDNSDNKVYTTEGTTLTLNFDPYPGNAKGIGKSGSARKASYTIKAYINDSTGKPIYSSETTIKDINLVHPMYVVVKTKRNAKIYTGKNTSKYKGTTGKGQYYVAIGGSRVKGKNKRVVIKVNGQLRYLKSGDVSTVKMWYSAKKGSNPYAKAGYDKAAIEDFINNKGLKSSPKFPPKRLIWVNTYNQRLYLFLWDSNANKWVIDKKTEKGKYKNGILVSTGKELSPYGVFTISGKWEKKKTTGTRWWCIFNSVGIHEKLGGKLGVPASGGCIRIPDRDAYLFYWKYIKKKTTVFVY